MPWILQRLGIAPSATSASEAPRVVSYLFDSVEDKRRLMGAGFTYIAKPWRRGDVPAPRGLATRCCVTSWRISLLGRPAIGCCTLALSRGVPQPGMIEGIAVAADWRGSGDQTPPDGARDASGGPGAAA